MALHAMWIRKNMLQSPSSDHSHNERKMSENEMRVLRSIQKLSIPDWYLNNSSRPPKILSNNTPIDQRPASWKTLPSKKTAEHAPGLILSGNSTVYRNGVPETKIGPFGASKNSGTYKINRISPVKKSPSSHRKGFQPKSKNIDKAGSKSKNGNTSQTFPRLSPSRKIQNINIVFPQPAKNSKRLIITDLDEPDAPVIDMTKDSLDSTNSEEFVKPWNPSETYTTLKPEVGSPRDEDAEGFKLRATSTPCKSPVSFASSKGFATTPGKENREPPSISLFPMCISQTEATSGSSKGETSKSLFMTGNSGELENESSKLGSSIYNTVSEAPSQNSPSSPAEKKNSPKTVNAKKSIIKASTEKCDSCKAASSKLNRTASSSPRGQGFRPKNLLPSIPEKALAQQPPFRKRDGASKMAVAVAPLPTPPRASPELEDLGTQPASRRKSLVSEIIEELNARCKISSQPTYVTPTSKNFVKELVNALENGVVPRKKYETDRDESSKKPQGDNELQYYAEEDVFVDSEHGSEDDIKSAAVSTSISYKGSDSSSNSDTDLDSPSIKHNYDTYDWNMNFRETPHNTYLKNNNNETTKNNNNLPVAEKEDEDWLYWNQKIGCDFPRTSSLLSVISRASLINAGNTSPCVSPIDQANDPPKSTSFRSSRCSANGWGTTYRTKKTNYNKFWPIEETTILDSGYSDKSSARSSRTSYIDDNATWYDYTETTQTASESGSYYSESRQDSVSSNSRKLEPLIHGRPFLI